MKTLVQPTDGRFSFDAIITPRARKGGPRRRTPAATSAEKLMRYGAVDYLGSHMPLDADAHWEWRNPLNVIPLMLLIFLVLAIIAMVF